MLAIMKRGLLSCLALALFPLLAIAQDETPKAVNNQNRSGDLPFSASVGTDVESVDIATGHLSIRIPFLSLPGRGMNYHFGLRYESGFWSAALRGTAPARYLWKVERRPYVTTAGLGWSITQPYLTSTSYREGCTIGSGFAGTYYIQHRDSYIYHDPDGAAHPFDLEHQQARCWDGIDNVGYVSTTGASPDTSGAGMWATRTFVGPANNSIRSADGTVLGSTGVG